VPTPSRALLERRRRRLVDHRSEPGSKRVAFGRPQAHARRLVGVLRQPLLDLVTLRRGEFVVQPGADDFVGDRRRR
jgi:hypothetical protein